MITKHRKTKLAIKFLVLSLLVLGAFETIALIGFRAVSRKLIQTPVAERGDHWVSLTAQKIHNQFKRYDMQTEIGRHNADQCLLSLGNLLNMELWIIDPDGMTYPRGFVPDARFLDAKPVSGDPNKFTLDDETKPNKLFKLFRPPFPVIGELLFKIPFDEADGRTSSLFLAHKKRDTSFIRIYLMDHLPAMLAGYVGILSGLPLMLIILYLLVMRPISRLRQSTTQIASGQLSHRHPVSGNDEIAQLGQSFNHMADQIEKMIQSTREVSGRLSHELRSPMSRLNLKKDLILLELEKIAGNGSARVLAEDMSKEIDQMDMLIDQMLDFARLDAAIVEAPKKAIDFKEILNDTLEAYGVDIQHQQIEMVLQLTSKTVTVMSTERDLIAIFQNLMGNALKFTPQRGLIYVRLTCRKRTLFLHFANTCEPLEEAALKQIFEPFNRNGDNSKPGNGLGLAIVKKIVENLEGSISAHPWEEQGICFEVRLPLVND